MLPDIEIARQANLLPIEKIAQDLGLDSDEIELYGKYKAKIDLEAITHRQDAAQGVYVIVTAITPTPLGEGKTTTTVGLGQALHRLGEKSIIAIRQPSLGPVFGIKGGAAGGGYSQVVPMEDFNLHLTGDSHAVTSAHNLCAAFLDNALFRNNRLSIDPESVMWRRVIDMNDRGLRDIVTGLGSGNGVVQQTGFDITAASEIMAILALATSLSDLRQRIGRIVVAFTYDGKPVTADDIGAAGAMTALMKDAIKPNLMQTLENSPALVHAGPFGNIAHGNSSILADQIGLKLADVLVTEAGFGSDLGAEKFFNIKCRASGLRPTVAVMVATIRALKAHSGRFRVIAGRDLPPEMTSENLEAISEGLPNLTKQIENVKRHGVPVVVAVNRFPDDTDNEVELVRRAGLDAGAVAVAESNVFAQGGEGGEELARSVLAAAHEPNSFDFLYDVNDPIKAKIETIAKEIYGAESVSYSRGANRAIRRFSELGYDSLPICMAKTHLSLSGTASLKGRPEGFNLAINEVRASIGAGFIYPIVGTMRTMPGLGSYPGGLEVDIDEDGDIVGLF